jgi:hypothetical protein
MMPSLRFGGNQLRRLALIIAATLSVAFGGADASAERRVALVIGNTAYLNIPRLANPGNDARLIAETLRTLGFTLVGDGPQLDLDKARLDASVKSFGRLLQNADVALFYYAGHGVQVRGANYLVPIEANPTNEADVDFEMLDTNVVLRQMESSGVRLNLVMLDACRNNPFGGRGLRNSGGGLAQMRAPEGTLISFATQPGNVALDGAGNNSIYTEALARAIRKPGVDIFRTFNEVGIAVSSATNGSQQPWLSLSPIKGDFYFVEAKASPAVTGADPSAAAQINPDPAAHAWASIRDTTSIAMLEDFVRRYGGSTYGSFARARVEELKKSQVAMAVDPRPRLPASFETIRASLPAGMKLDPDVVRAAQSDPFFANAPPLRVANWAHKGHYKKYMETSADVTVVDLRNGLMQVNSKNSNSFASREGSGRIRNESDMTQIAVGNGFITLSGYTSSTSFTPKKPIQRDSNGHWSLSLELTGHLFPIAVGNEFAKKVSVRSFPEYSSNLTPTPAKEIRCRVTEKIAARNFHRDLNGDAYIVVCGDDKILRAPKSTDARRSSTVFFEELGVFLSTDAIDPNVFRRYDEIYDRLVSFKLR